MSVLEKEKPPRGVLSEFYIPIKDEDMLDALIRAWFYVIDHESVRNELVLPTPEKCSEFLANLPPEESDALKTLSQQYYEGNYAKELFKMFGKSLNTDEWMRLILCLSALELKKCLCVLLERAVKKKSACGIFIHKRKIAKRHKETA